MIEEFWKFTIQGFVPWSAVTEPIVFAPLRSITEELVVAVAIEPPIMTAAIEPRTSVCTVPETLWLAGGVNDAAIDPEIMATATEPDDTVIIEEFENVCNHGAPPWKATTEPAVLTFGVPTIVAATLPEIGKIPPEIELTTVTLFVTTAATEPETGKIPPAIELVTVHGLVPCVATTLPLTFCVVGKLLTLTAPETDWLAGGVKVAAMEPLIMATATEERMSTCTVPDTL